MDIDKLFNPFFTSKDSGTGFGLPVAHQNAGDYLTKPIDPEELLIVVSRALERQKLIEEVASLRQHLDRKYGFENIIGHSDALISVLEMASRAARTNSTILIRAETGTWTSTISSDPTHRAPRAQIPVNS